MEIRHNQFVIEVLEENGKYYATANRMYDRGCTGMLCDTALDAINNVIRMARTLRECDATCCGMGKCPKDCVCPWNALIAEASERFAFEYWASEQNRAEDPQGYNDFIRRLNEKA